MPRVATLRRSDALGVHLCFYEAGESQRAHRHDTHQLTIVLAGDYREDSDEGPRTVRGGALGTKPAGYEHANQFGPHGALILSVNVVEDQPIGSYHVAAADRGLDSEAWRAIATGAGLAPLLRRFREDVSSRIPLDDSGHGPDWIEPARAALESPDARIDSLAADLGMHPVALTRGFRRHTGMTPRDWRTTRGVARGIEQLVAGRAPIAEVAIACGFADQAHFNRRVRGATGFTPGELRRMLTV